RPSTTSQPASRAAVTSAVSPGPYARSTTTWPACGSTSNSSRTGVALTIRSHPAAWGGQSPEREKTRVSSGSTPSSACAAPPAPITHARRAAMPARISRSVLKPSTRPSRKTSVLTASPSASSHAATTARLYGIVTFAPAKPSARRARTASRGSATSHATYVQASPHAANAAFCIRGDSDSATGRPSSATFTSAAVAVRALVLGERARAGGEEVVHLVGLAHEVEVIDLRRVRRRLERGETGVRDGRRRKGRAVARVVRARALELRFPDRLVGRDVEPVVQRRVDPERHPRVQSVVDHRGDQAALRRRLGLLLDHRRDRQHVVGRQVLRARVRQVDRLPVAAERLHLVGDELLRRRLREEVVGGREEESLHLRACVRREARHDDPLRRSEVRGA